MDLPDSIPYKQTQLAVNTHSFSGHLLKNYPNLIDSLLLVKKTAAIANRKTKIISDNAALAIMDSCDQIIANKNYDAFNVDVFQGGGGIGIHMNIIEAIQSNSHESNLSITEVNASQSTADVCATASRLTLIHLYHKLSKVLDQSIVNFKQKAQEFSAVEITALTCMQDAMPATLDTLFLSYHDLLKRRAILFENAIQALYSINLGGTVIGSGEGASKAYQMAVIKELNNSLPFTIKKRKNLYDAAQNIDELGDISNQLALLATCFIKIGKDLRLLSSGPSTGFKILEIPHIIKGSSFFKAKNNPTIIETLINCAFLILGKDRSVQAALEHPELHLNIFETVAVINIYDALNMLTSALSNFNEYCLNGLIPRKQ